jgi:ribosomal protein L11 methylase PrmA
MMKTRATTNNRVLSSFRDPSGFLFHRDGLLYRQVNQGYAADYEKLISSGLYESLTKSGRLVPHREVELVPEERTAAYKVIQPEVVRFISYPYEWSFSQLKEAALATLSIQKRAIQRDMSLKDASAYNIQVHNGRMTLIDTLSFESYREGEPWVAYRQFCQHFLAPLALMAWCDIRLGQLSRIHIDGVPLDLASRLLPRATFLNPGLASHIHLHARAQRDFAQANVQEARRGRKLSREALLNILQSLKTTVQKLSWKPAGTEWAEYYSNTNYQDEAFRHKAELVGSWLASLKPGLSWDLGANNGYFSRIAAQGQGTYVVAADIDPAAVEANYLQCRKDKQQNILPLVLDLTNPSPAIGWENRERDAFLARGEPDAVLALALIHHLAISNNLPLERIAAWLAVITKTLIIEFIPKTDSQVEKLLRNRPDIFPDYSREGFERAFTKHFRIEKCAAIHDSERILFLLKRV